MSTKVEVKRDALGRVLPGASLNPGGRARAVRELLALARESVPRALALAAEFVANEDMDARVRLDAAKVLLGYGLGTPPKMGEAPDEDITAQLKAMSDEDLERIVRNHLMSKPSPPVDVEPVEQVDPLHGVGGG